VDYLTQQLDGVYRYRDPRTYPLSSYSYMILPTKQEYSFNQNKGYTLSRFAYYFLCEGQQQADVLGYSPLPINLVQAGFAQVKRIPGVQVQNITIAGCHNPTFSTNGTNTLATTAPQPSPCDKQGPKQSTAGTAGARQETPVAAAARCSGSAGGGPSGSSGNGNGNGTGNGTAGPGGASPTGSAGPGATGGAIDPITGEQIGGGDSGNGGGEGDVNADNVSLDGEGGWGVRHTIMAIAAGLVIGLVLGPPLLSQSLRRRREQGPGSVR
jgi:hypothetical protein